MTYWSGQIVPDDRQLFEKTMGEHVAEMVRAKYLRCTAKVLAMAWEISLSTAESVIKGHASERVLAKAIRAEGWVFLEELGHRMTGQSYVDWKAEEINKIMEETERAKSNIERLRTSAASLAGAPARHDGADYRAGSASRRTG